MKGVELRDCFQRSSDRSVPLSALVDDKSTPIEFPRLLHQLALGSGRKRSNIFHYSDRADKAAKTCTGPVPVYTCADALATIAPPPRWFARARGLAPIPTIRRAPIEEEADYVRTLSNYKQLALAQVGQPASWGPPGRSPCSPIGGVGRTGWPASMGDGDGQRRLFDFLPDRKVTDFPASHAAAAVTFEPLAL
jgi:hypothetical protein